MKKERLDVLLVKGGYASSRERAKAIIMSGNVFVDGQREDKAGSTFSLDADIDVRQKDIPFVSRGGLKLAKAVDTFSLDLEGRVCTDVGASTGGFTDCMLQHGAKKVYAIDVGYGQLAWQLRSDERVVCMEKTNIRHVTKEMLEDGISFSSVDVSFISLTKVLPHIYDYLTQDGEVAALIKPQFEAGREQVGKKGVVRDPKVHVEVIRRILAFSRDSGWHVRGLTYSPVKGPEGNIEYLVHLSKRETDPDVPVSPEQIVELAVLALSNGTGAKEE